MHFYELILGQNFKFKLNFGKKKYLKLIKLYKSTYCDENEKKFVIS